jgi:hypothetical protein
MRMTVPRLQSRAANTALSWHQDCWHSCLQESLDSPMPVALLLLWLLLTQHLGVQPVLMHLGARLAL